jgi:hypothetical protein
MVTAKTVQHRQTGKYLTPDEQVGVDEADLLTTFEKVSMREREREYACVPEYVCACVRVCVYVYVYMCIYVCVDTCTCVCVHVYICVYV